MKHYTAAPGEDNFIGEGIIFCLVHVCTSFFIAVIIFGML